MNNKILGEKAYCESVISSFEITSITFNENNTMGIYRIKYVELGQGFMQQLTANEFMMQPSTYTLFNKVIMRNLVDNVIGRG